MAVTMRFLDVTQGDDAEALWIQFLDSNTPIPRPGDEVLLGADLEYVGHVAHLSYWYEDYDTVMVNVWLNLKELPE